MRVDRGLRLSILVTSEDIGFYLYFEHVFESESFIPFFANNLEDTLRIARDQKPYAILLDCRPQAFPNAETCKCLKYDPRTASIPVFALVDPRAEDDYVRLLNAGAHASFFRPLAPTKLGRYA